MTVSEQMYCSLQGEAASYQYQHSLINMTLTDLYVIASLHVTAHRERERITTVQACPGSKNFYSKFSPMMALSRPALSAGFLQHAKRHTKEPCFAVYVHRSRVLVLHELIICSACSLSGTNIFSSFVSRC